MDTICYEYGSNLYVNLTNRCDCACTFCLRNNGAGGSIYADNLWLEREPTRQELVRAIREREPEHYPELVFCGFGEPTCRIDDIFWVIDQLKPHLPPVRINTNGHANLIHGRDVTPELAGRVDVLSISLNASTCREYLALTRPRAGAAAWDAMLDFTRRAAQYVPKVVMTVVDKGDKSPAEIEACRALCTQLGATLRVRSYISK
ncbi:MAG: TatD family nuclease-associated radical SAM protein [Oscillospiraceae bacterium]|nr:TatD family nuclease-associated radical SAM protein [Oscillospiraceae bacterium]